jgi:hypothetical protein
MCTCHCGAQPSKFFSIPIDYILFYTINISLQCCTQCYLLLERLLLLQIYVLCDCWKHAARSNFGISKKNFRQETWSQSPYSENCLKEWHVHFNLQILKKDCKADCCGIRQLFSVYSQNRKHVPGKNVLYVLHFYESNITHLKQGVTMSKIHRNVIKHTTKNKFWIY